VVGEFALLAAIRDRLDGDGPGLPLGVDDDAAVLDVPGRVVLAVDALVDDVHVDRSISSLADLGWKAIAVNVSDLAAVGALPLAALVTLLRPSWFDVDHARELYDGMREAAQRWDCRLVGGDTVSCPTLSVSIAVAGRLVDDAVVLRRDGARPGDLVAVVGDLGLAAAGLELHQGGHADLLSAHPELSAAHRRPVALVEAAEPLVASGVTACIDVSDGLGRDLGHVARASGVAVHLDAERLPIPPGVAAAAARLGRDPLELAVGGGDDYALAVTVPPDRLEDLAAALAAVGLSARVLGEVAPGTGVTVDGRDVATAGWEHH
jgi:thiamine-monophosphate kinase